MSSCRNVVEFGCGYGTFTVPLAKLSRYVIALDIEQNMINETQRKVAVAGLQNVTTLLRDFTGEGSGRPDAQADYAVLFNILHIENPIHLLRETYRILIPGGKVGIIHWRNDLPTPRGPSLAVRPSLKQCQDWGQQAGFEFVREESLRCCSWHWGMVLQRPNR